MSRWMAVRVVVATCFGVAATWAACRTTLLAFGAPPNLTWVDGVGTTAIFLFFRFKLLRGVGGGWSRVWDSVIVGLVCVLGCALLRLWSVSGWESGAAALTLLVFGNCIVRWVVAKFQARILVHMWVAALAAAGCAAVAVPVVGVTLLCVLVVTSLFGMTRTDRGLVAAEPWPIPTMTAVAVDVVEPLVAARTVTHPPEVSPPKHLFPRGGVTRDLLTTRCLQISRRRPGCPSRRDRRGTCEW